MCPFCPRLQRHLPVKLREMDWATNILLNKSKWLLTLLLWLPGPYISLFWMADQTSRNPLRILTRQPQSQERQESGSLTLTSSHTLFIPPVLQRETICVDGSHPQIFARLLENAASPEDPWPSLGIIPLDFRAAECLYLTSISWNQHSCRSTSPAGPLMLYDTIARL